MISTTVPGTCALISQDSPFGAGTITRDTSTGLSWLDLSVTAGISWDTMQPLLQLGGTYEQFRYATDAERTELFVNAGIPDVPGQTAANIAPVTALMALLGGPLSIAENPATGFRRESLIGHLGQPGGLGSFIGGYLAVDTVSGVTTATAFPGIFGSSLTDFGSSGTGHWLVAEGSIQSGFQPVPEPGSMVLLGAGMGALALLRRRRTN